jgi:hypothetical protein
MANLRLNNALFALLVGAALGATAWSVAAREPALVKMPPPPVAAKARPGTIPTAEQKTPDEKKGAIRNPTERMIDEGKLSKQPARYYRKATP